MKPEKLRLCEVKFQGAVVGEPYRVPKGAPAWQALHCSHGLSNAQDSWLHP